MLAHLIVWLDERGVTRPADVTRPMLERYQRWLFHYRKTNGDPLTFRSQSQRLLAVRAFYKWAARQHHVHPQPRRGARTAQSRTAATETGADRRRSRDGVADARPDHGGRGAGTGRCSKSLYSTGIRRIELAGSAPCSTSTHDRHTLLVRQGKGRKDRLIPIGERALEWIDRYIAEARHRRRPRTRRRCAVPHRRRQQLLASTG